MLKYVTKFAMDILPSVAATIIGAYIVNHYISNKPADAPVAAAVSTADPKATSDGKATEASADTASIPESGVKAKGVSEKSVFDRAAIEKIIEKSADKPSEKSTEKSADKPAETASAPVDTKRHVAPAREKAAVAKSVPAVTPPVVAVVPAVAPNPAPSVEAAVTPDRDANDLARAAIERLRGTGDSAARRQEAPRAPEPQVVSAPALNPLPPPIMVSAPPREALGPGTATGASSMRPPYAASRNDDPNRPTPPADIPSSRPLDLRADAADQAPPPPREHTNVAEDVLSGVKSVFHAVLPK